MKLVAQTVAKQEDKYVKQRAIDHFVEKFKTDPVFSERKFKRLIKKHSP